MSKMLKIFYIAPEVAPFARTYGVADVAGALPKALKDFGHDIRVMMPNYKHVNARKYVLRDVIRLKDMKISYDDREIQVSAKSAFLPNSKVQIYFLDNREYYGRDGLYIDPRTGAAYPDNDERFILFCKGCLETLRMLHWQPDIIHCNDWQAALIPTYIKKALGEDEFFKDTKVIFSIFDFYTDAITNPATLDRAGIPKELFLTGDSGIKNGGINILNAALQNSDLVFVDNKIKTREIAASPGVSEGFGYVMARFSEKIVGLSSGIDESVWNPKSDKLLASKYDIENIDRKKANKKDLLERYAFRAAGNAPLACAIVEPEDGGLDAILGLLDGLMELELSLILLSKGAGEAKEKLIKFRGKYADRFVLIDTYEDDSIHELMAGADVFLAPYDQEPASPYHLIGMKYGVVPVVKIGDWNGDTLIDCRTSPEQGTGLVYTGQKGSQFLQAVEAAVKLYQDDEKWKQITVNAMEQDNSWHARGPEFIEQLTSLF